jgi:hypothetical protein
VIVQKDFWSFWRWISFLIPFAMVSAPWFVNTIKQQAWWLSIVGIVLLLIRGFCHSFSLYDQLKQGMEPRLLPSYDVNSGCKKTHSSGDWHQDTFRLAVYNTGETAINGCKGVLTEIRFAGDKEPIFGGDNRIFVFAPNEWEEADNKTVYHTHPEFLDVLFLDHKNGNRSDAHLGTKGGEWPSYFKSPMEMFDKDGVYYFKIIIVSGNAPPIPVQMKFTLSKKAGESRAELEAIEPYKSAPKKAASNSSSSLRPR